MTPGASRYTHALDATIAIGQVWRHHTTGPYRVVGFDQEGRVLICRADSMQPHHVWPDYFRRNLTLERAS